MIKLFNLSVLLLLTGCLYSQHKQNLYLDRFNKADFQSLKVGKWNTYSDSSHGGGTHTALSYTKDEKIKSQVLYFFYSLLKKDWEYRPYAGISCSINVNALPEVSIEGIAYEFKGSKHSFNYLTSSITDHCYFKKQIPESKEWTTIIIPFSELKQEQWGLKVPFNYSDLTAFTWAVNGSDHDSGCVFIDNVRFIQAEKKSINNIPTDNLIHFTKPDSVSNKIFNTSNDSLFKELSEYNNKSQNYYTSFKKIHASEILIDSLIQTIKVSSLSSEEKESLSTLLVLAANKTRGDLIIKMYEHNFHWKKKYNKFIFFDTLCLIDKEYQKAFSTFQVMNVWASDEWNYASLYKTPKAKDSSHLKEILSFHLNPNDIIAEIGAGPGYLEQNFSKFCNDLIVYVNEIDSASASKLDTKLHLLDRYDDKNIQYITILGNEKSSQLPDSIFDKIIIKNTFHHFSYPKEMLLNLKSVLKKNGRIYVVDILMDEIEKPECPFYMKRAEFLKYFTDNGYMLVQETPLSYHNKCFEFQVLP